MSGLSQVTQLARLEQDLDQTVRLPSCSLHHHCPTCHSKSSAEAERAERQKPRHSKEMLLTQGHMASVGIIGIQAWGRGTAVPRGPVLAHVTWEDTVKVAASWLQAAEDTSLSSVGATVRDVTNPGGGLKR